MITISDLSKKTGFSKTTVSKALNNYSDISEQTKKLILEAAEELQYFPNANARSLVTKRSWTIGVVFEENTGVGLLHPFFGDILDKFKRYVESLGYDILFLSQSLGGNKKLSYYEHCKQKGVDGIIILCSFFDVEPINKLIESEIPTVIIDHETTLTNCVYTNNYKCIYDAVNYLFKKGHKQIAHIHGDLYSFVGKERYNGYIQALKDINIPIRQDYLLWGGSYTFKEGYDRGIDIINMKDRPTAVIAASDNLAVGMMKAFNNNNIRIPEDISIIGFDDTEISNLVSPSLTTIHQDKEKIAIEAAKSLINKIEKKECLFENKVIDGLIIERNTVKNLI